MSGNELCVAVLGAGVAGLTLSAALDRVGVRHEVYEQAPRLTEVGAGIQLAPNAVRVLDRLGLAEHLRTVAVRIDAIVMRRWDDGDTICRQPLGAECERIFGAAYYAVHRADLLAGLTSVLSAVQLGRRCVRAESDVDGAQLVFDDGVVQADVVVGADGIHSIVRDRITPDRPRFSGQTIYRAVVPADRLASRRAQVELFLGPGQHAVVYPVAGGRQFSFAATVPARDWTDESWTASGSVPELLAAYQGWHPDLLEVFAAASTVRRWAVHDRNVIPRWSDGRLTLLGDAAHPMLPFFAQGANQAIEDAAVLARCLAAADDLAAALRGYEAERGPRTERIHRTSRENGRLLHLPDGREQQERDRQMAGGMPLSARAWLYGYDADEAPSYQGSGT
ncbi:FAD-dependent monooxygenase [Actinophytocola sp.]|uniref:FAD-dependent monooxygenase n=1 Tax=Actinophytocola sp. TaxID=1872138 RepID=UPI00389A094B